MRDVIFNIAGGLALFLFGMGLMSDGLKEAAGQKLRDLLESITRHRVIAALVGALTTCLIQSSSATTVMTVGFVNAGLLTLKQALGVVLGANVGTTFTAWLVSVFGIAGFKITLYSLPTVGLGFLLQILGRGRARSVGSILLGLGLLFLGISFMKEAFEPLKTNQEAQTILIYLGQNPLLAVLAGTAMTILLQSSSAAIMMVQVMAFQGAFGTNWELAMQVTIPFILGDNIGTTITAQLAALRTSRNSKRVAIGHTIFNVIGVIYMLPLVWIGVFGKIVIWICPWQLSQSTIPVHLAIAHSTFNVFNTVIFLPMIQWLEAVVLKILPVKKREKLVRPVVLEEHLLNTPAIALQQANREMVWMARTARRALRTSISGIASNGMRRLNSVKAKEDLIDELQLEITSYLSKLSRRQISDELAVRLPVLLHTVNDLERIGDHAMNIVEIAERKVNQKLTFSESAMAECSELKKQVDQMFRYVIKALAMDDKEAAKSALVIENNLNRMQIDFRRNHVRRMTENRCSPELGLIFVDLVDNVEKCGDHLTNIAQSVIGGLQWEGVEPKIPIGV